jgi:Icc-related predicted phosphoesterase
VCVSDTHELHRDLIVPDGDLLIHAGDFTFFSKRPSMLRDFDRWLGSLPHRYKVLVPGNHDYFLEEERNRGAIMNAELLVASGVEVAGLKIWGSPVTPLYGGAFSLSNAEDRNRHWAKIPANLDILVTHGPPRGILDRESPQEPDAGCHELALAVERMRPRFHIFGHIHGGRGIHRTPATVFINASVYRDGGIEYPAIVVEISRPGASDFKKRQ